MFESFPERLFDISLPIWRYVLWNPERKSMVMNNQTLTEIILLYFWKRDLLKGAEIEKMYKELRILNQLVEIDDVMELVMETEKIIYE